MIIKYKVEGEVYDMEIPDTYCATRPLEQDVIINECANDYYHKNGYNSKWPLMFELFNGGGALGSFKVFLEYVPDFIVTRK